MKNTTFWRGLLIVLPAIGMIMFFVPGAVWIKDIEGQYLPYSLVFYLPETTPLLYCSYLFPVLGIYLLGSGIYFYKNEGEGMVKCISIFSCVALFFTAVPLLIDSNIAIMPYVILPILFACNGMIAAVVVKKISGNKHEDITEEILNRRK